MRGGVGGECPGALPRGPLEDRFRKQLRYDNPVRSCGMQDNAGVCNHRPGRGVMHTRGGQRKKLMERGGLAACNLATRHGCSRRCSSLEARSA
eukprot:14305053-Alexandrium_andersonii.AAC.1